MNFEYRANESAASLREVGLSNAAQQMETLAIAYDSVSSDEFETMAGLVSDYFTNQVMAKNFTANQVPAIMVAFAIIESV